MENPLQELINKAEALTESGPPPGKTYLGCPLCGYTTDITGGMPPATCDKCKGSPKWVSGRTPAEAKSAAVKIKLAQAQPPSEPIQPPAHAQPAPKLVEDAPPPPPVEPRATRTRRRPADPTPAPAAAPSDPNLVGPTDIDGKQRRLEAVAKLIHDHNLNDHTPVEVGTATVTTVGYTTWKDGLPTQWWMAPTDTPASFKSEFLFQKSQPGQAQIEFDVVRCALTEPPALEACLFRGNMTVDLNSGHGLMRVMAGAKIRVGALRTKAGVRFVMLGVV